MAEQPAHGNDGGRCAPGSAHDHAHNRARAPGAVHGAGTPAARLRLAIPLTLAVFAAELAGGLWSSSLALLSDSLHVLFDATALGLSYAAIVLAARPASDRHSYGLHRGEILAALANGLTVALIAAWIFSEAWERLHSPRPIRAGGMMGVALAGLVANAVVARLLHGHHHDDLNVRGAYLHVLGDLLASAAVVAGGAVIWATGWTLIDPLLGFAIGLLLLWGAGRLVRESLHVLMEGVPAGVTVEGVVAAVLAVPGVSDLHRVHIWSLCSHIRALSAHLTVEAAGGRETQAVVDDVNALLHERFGITHTTLQSECRGCADDGPYCTPVHPGEERIARL
ncbi:MAG TPA: cation diffusion facilitator family transporter [Candidatus Methanoperedens sp.]|nr:cation diffusion facilitator family transporter [Candidatus Methanoperedens sp.]